MNNDYWQITATMFSSLFERPRMTERLLLKPPFKYLFDIIIQTSKSTGFARNLYTQEELSPDFYDTREKKIYFLNKIITLVGEYLKEEIQAKPSIIVAGLEPDKTNLFLQALYRAAISGIDSDLYVKKSFPSQQSPKEDVGSLKQEDPETFFVCIDSGDKEISDAKASQIDIEKIQKLIQSLTQNVTPLRKSIDFINDDIESMNKEKNHWRDEYLNSKVEYQVELENSKEQLKELESKYQELEAMIKDKKLKSQAVKSLILQNEKKIQKLLYTSTK